MRILIAEDDRLTRRILEKYLAELKYEVFSAEDGEQAWELIERHKLNFIITDWVMPNLNGLELVLRIRNKEDLERSYIILLTSKGEKAEIIKGITSGADDFITKPFDKDILAVRVRAGQRILDLHARLEELTLTDPLTGLANRRGLFKHVRGNMEDFIPEGVPVAFVMADIDHFKQINDNHGHDVGDIAIKCVAERLESEFRDYDTVSRIGGEEFFIIAYDIEPHEVGPVVDRVRKNIEQMPICMPAGGEIFLTCSFGVVCRIFDGEWDIEKYMKLADDALYESKNGGRNRVTIQT